MEPRSLKNYHANAPALAGHLGFADTAALRGWILGPSFWPFYLDYAAIKEADGDRSWAPRNVEIKDVYKIISLQSDLPNIDPGSGPWAHLVQIITRAITANIGVSPPVLRHEADLDDECYHRAWQVIRWANRMRARSDKDPENVPPVAPPDWVKMSTTLRPGPQQPAPAPDLNFQFFWANRDGIQNRPTANHQEYWPDQVQPLLAPPKYPDPRYFCDDIRLPFGRAITVRKSIETNNPIGRVTKSERKGNRGKKGNNINGY
ncbi:hypothetical protein FGG08_004127 [Glutinoglossum americanum]|uniref:Uncharacterized protein n=1 Tax=Glutinoglossum americanum TaxID=1670608 RepID=A0A9P8I6D7_9PEZI|nr:hypothetical protein FGG08_004127 [Glutinoglossum americanum]